MFHPDDIEDGFGPRLWDATPGVCCAAFQLGACSHTEDFDYAASGEAHYAAAPTMEYVAKFPDVAGATSFADRMNEGGWYLTNVVRKGRTVTFTGPVRTEDGYSYLGEMLGTVGYYGSTQSRKATLNGHRAPMSY